MRVIFNVKSNRAAFEMMLEKLKVVKEGDYYNKPCGWRTLPRDADGEREDYYVTLRGEYAGFSTERKCGYTISDDAVIYIASSGNMSWVRWLGSDRVAIGYWGARHGQNLRRIVDDEQYDLLRTMNPFLYVTQEPTWKWDETLDEHPEDPRHRSHWPEEAA